MFRVAGERSSIAVVSCRPSERPDCPPASVKWPMWTTPFLAVPPEVVALRPDPFANRLFRGHCQEPPSATRLGLPRLTSVRGPVRGPLSVGSLPGSFRSHSHSAVGRRKPDLIGGPRPTWSGTRAAALRLPPPRGAREAAPDAPGAESASVRIPTTPSSPRDRYYGEAVLCTVVQRLVVLVASVLFDTTRKLICGCISTWQAPTTRLSHRLGLRKEVSREECQCGSRQNQWTREYVWGTCLFE